MKALATSLVLISASLAFAQTIVCPPGAPANMKLAAKEIRRYVYLRHGKLLPIAGVGQGIALNTAAGGGAAVPVFADGAVV